MTTLYLFQDTVSCIRGATVSCMRCQMFSQDHTREICGFLDTSDVVVVVVVCDVAHEISYMRVKLQGVVTFGRRPYVLNVTFAQDEGTVTNERTNEMLCREGPVTCS